MSFVLMIITAAGMVFAYGKYRATGVLWGRPLAGLLGLLTLLIVIAKMVAISNAPRKQRERIVQKDLLYLTAAMEHVGDYIATRYPQETILLITKSATENSSGPDTVILEGLHRGLDDNYKKLVFDSPRPSAASFLSARGAQDQEESTIFSGDTFDLLIKLHPDASLIVSLIGLPDDIDTSKFWKLKRALRPKVIVLFPDVYELENPIQKGLITAIVTYNPKFRPNLNKEVPDDIQEIFDDRFMLIDIGNIKKIVKEFPNMFSKNKDDEDEG